LVETWTEKAKELGLMTTVTIKHNDVTCSISEDVVMLDDMIALCRRAINGVGFHCEELVEDLYGDFSEPAGE
jgi:hypothetical protein